MPISSPKSDVPLDEAAVKASFCDPPLSTASEAPEGGISQRRWRTLYKAALSLAAESSLEDVLRKIPDLARQIVGARYCALGLPDGHGGLADFIPAGLTQEEINLIGKCPRGRGILGVLLRDPRPLRLRNLQQDFRSAGFPPSHPPMSSFLGVPIQRQGRILGYLYLTEKRDASEFSVEDQTLAGMWADYAAIAIENARRYEQEQRQAQQRQLINEISRKVASTLDMEAVLSYATRLIRETFGYYAVNIGLVEGDRLVFRAGLWGPAVDVQREIHLRVGHEGITGWVAATAQPLLVPDVRTDSRYYPVAELPNTRSELAVPICWRDQVLGVLDVQSDRPGGLDKEDLALLESLAPHIALAIQNARMFEKEQQRVQRLLTLNEIAEKLASRLEMADLMAAITKYGSLLTGFPRCMLFTPEEEGRYLVARASNLTCQELGVKDLAEIRLPVDQSLSGDALQRRKIAIAEDYPHDPRRAPEIVERFHVRSALAVPLIFEGRVQGVMSFGTMNRPHRFTDEEIELIKNFARLVAVALENARLIADQKRVAESLTALLQMSQTISTRMPLEKIMETISEVARGVIGTPCAGFFLWREETGHLIPEQAYTTTEEAMGVFHALRGPWSEFPHLEAFKETGQLVVIEEITKLPPHWRAIVERFGLRSMLVAPTIGQQRWFGLLALADTRPRTFTRREISLAEIIAREAAVAIENVWLYEQAKQERDRQATLLQETRHRIKNNLQTMIGFLSYMLARQQEIDLSKALPTVIERLKAMAAIQDMLLVSAAEAVGFQSMVAKVVEPALMPPDATDKPPTLTFEGVDLVLSPVAAEALALAINELVLNAVKHGRATRITIRTTIQADRVVVEVIDNGIGLPLGFDPDQDAGLGLSIVDRLVRRSLEGTLLLTRLERGTAVIIEMPLDVLMERRGTN
jgi:GAF domain-containing protein